MYMYMYHMCIYAASQPGRRYGITSVGNRDPPANTSYMYQTQRPQIHRHISQKQHQQQIYIYIHTSIYNKIREIPISDQFRFFVFYNIFLKIGLMGWIWIHFASLNTL